jgi:hypothetical protein
MLDERQSSLSGRFGLGREISAARTGTGGFAPAASVPVSGSLRQPTQNLVDPVWHRPVQEILVVRPQPASNAVKKHDVRDWR